MKVYVPASRGRQAAPLNAKPHQNASVFRVAAVLLYGLLGTCQQLSLLRSEWRKTLHAPKIFKMDFLQQEYDCILMFLLLQVYHILI